MKQHTTNYIDTFIEVAEDSPAETGTIPPQRAVKTAAQAEYEMIAENPYRHTSDEVIYEVRSRPKGLSREEFFSKGQPCFRASALPKRYGWGVHSDEKGRLALYPVESEEYARLAADAGIQHLRAMRNGRK